MKNLKYLVLMSVIILIIPTCTVFGDTAVKKGEKEMVLQGGTRGNVAFPHERHQKSLGDCQKCHSIFPQDKGSIQKMIGEGKLKKKAVMDHCKDCHKEMATKGEKTGPTSCSKCHDKTL